MYLLSLSGGALTVAKLKRELERERHKNSQLTSQLKRQTQLQGRLVSTSSSIKTETASTVRSALSRPICSPFFRLLSPVHRPLFTHPLAAQQLQAEQEEEYITNKLMKRLEALKQEKEELARQVEVEEEMITNALTKKLQKVKEEKVQLENQLEQEQEYIVNKLQKQLSAVLQEKTALETRLRENTSSILQSIQQHLARWKIDDPSAVAAGRVAEGEAAAGAAAAAPAAVVGHLMPSSPSDSAPPTPSSVPTVGNEDGPPPPHPAEWLPASTTAGASDADEWQRTHLLVSHLTCEIDQLGAQQERFRSECESQRQSNEKLRLELQKLQSDNASLTRRVAREREIRSAAILDRARLETELELDSERAFNNSSARSSVTSSPALSSQRGEALFPSAWSLPSPRGVTPSLLTPSVVSSVSGTLSPRAPSPKTGGGTPSRDSFSHGGHLSPKPGTPMSPKYGALSGNVS